MTWCCIKCTSLGTSSNTCHAYWRREQVQQYKTINYTEIERNNTWKVWRVGLEQISILKHVKFRKIQHVGSVPTNRWRTRSSVVIATSTQHYDMTGDSNDHLPLYHKWLHSLQHINIIGMLSTCLFPLYSQSVKTIIILDE